MTWKDDLAGEINIAVSRRRDANINVHSDEQFLFGKEYVRSIFSTLHLKKPIQITFTIVTDEEEEIAKLKDCINDLTLSLSMWIEGYPFDEDHKEKQRRMVDYASVLIGKPRTPEELMEMIK
jgi:hypothetical protein